jgi:hypothetical protein
LEEIAEAIRNSGESRADKIEDLKQRKLYNTSTSISFGNEHVDYETDARMRQKDILRAQNDPVARQRTLENNKKMKKHLTRTNFNLGDEPVEYQTASTIPHPGQNIGQYRGELQEEVKKMVKSSHLDFGRERVDYKTVAHDSMELTSRHGGEAGGPDRKAQEERTKALRRSHFTIGEDDGSKMSDFRTDYQNSFFHHGRAYQDQLDRGDGISEMIQDLRSAHWRLGDEKVEYSTQTRDEQKKFVQSSPEEILNQRRKNADLKLSLQKTSFVIGDDEEYM